MNGGYIYRRVDGREIPEHRLVVERILGRPLPTRVHIHHVDGNRKNNEPRNLVVCENIGYHKLLHFRADLIKAGANPNTERICKACGAIKPLRQFTIDRRLLASGRHWNCRPCKRAYDAAGKVRRKAEMARLTEARTAAYVEVR